MPRFRLRTLRLFALLLFLGLAGIILLRWFSLERWHWRATRQGTAELERLATPPPRPTPPPVISGKLETTKLFNGITVRSVLETPEGPASATEERDNPESYVLDLKLQARLPKANQTMEELATVNPELPTLLPGLPAMIANGSVSSFYERLYRTKVERLRARLSRLDQLLSRHNFYDCQTALNLTHPETKRRAVLIQAEMDVDADGSDSDRLPAGSGVSPNFQPFTSYRWPKKSDRPNPYLPGVQEKLRRYEKEMGEKATSAARKAELKDALARGRDEITSLKKWSYLIGATDPFIVMPGGLSAEEGTKVGDYAVVIHGDKIYPAFIGDVGPSDKAGEASLRIAKEINDAATPLNRPVSDLKVTYLIFPDTGERPWTPPDLEKIRARCEELVKEIGGSSVALHQWQDIIPPLPTPTPTPTPTPSPTPAGSVSPTVSPGASPAPTFAFPTPSVSPAAPASPASSPAQTPTPTSTSSPRSSPSATATATAAKKKSSPSPAKKSSPSSPLPRRSPTG